MGISGKEHNNNNIEVHLEEDTTGAENYIQFDKIHFRINKKDLFRVYSRNSWKKHGRFYGGLQINLPKVLRKHIYLNGSPKPMVSYDFGGLHPRLAYHLKGLPFVGNPYIIEGFGESFIKYFKTICLVALNAKNRHQAILAIGRKFRAKGITRFEYDDVKFLLDKFINHHRDIAEYICKDFGIDAMYWDAQVMEDCMNELMIKPQVSELL